jgi:hypothetical protein
MEKKKSSYETQTVRKTLKGDSEQKDTAYKTHFGGALKVRVGTS